MPKPPRSSPKSLAKAGEFDISPTPPFSFRLTVRKPAGWDLFTRGEVFEGGTLWTGIRFHGRPVGLKIQFKGSTDSPKVSIAFYSSDHFSGSERDELSSAIGICLGADQDVKDFYAFAADDPILKHVVKSLYGMHDTQTLSLFNSVLLSICLQMARLKRSNEMMEAIDGKYGEKIEFDGKAVRLEPSPETIAKLDPRSFAEECRLGYRAKYIVAAAKMITAGFPEMSQIMAMDPEEAKEKLKELPGVGDYAADIINPHGGFPIDAWSVDVFGLLFFGNEPEDRRAAIEAVKKEGIRRWGRWSWMAFFYIAQDLQNLSKQLGVSLRLE